MSFSSLYDLYKYKTISDFNDVYYKNLFDSFKSSNLFYIKNFSKYFDEVTKYKNHNNVAYKENEKLNLKKQELLMSDLDYEYIFEKIKDLIFEEISFLNISI